MAGSATRNRLPKSASRRVTASQDDFDTEHGRRKCGCSSICSSCCAWVSLIIGTVALLFLLCAGIIFAFLQSNLPEVRLQRLDVNKLQAEDKNQETLLSASFEVKLNVTNGSGRMELAYSGMTATMMSAGFNFDNVELNDMRQAPHTTTDIYVKTSAKREVVDEATAQELKDKSKVHVLVITVGIKGRIDFYSSGSKMISLPFKIDCHSIDQSEIDNGHAPKCNTRLTPLGWSV
ncbi:hypothetical protein Salat_0425900 [Sesamum alatum]|uniref:Late embryogenesis abundant protein LEA-2 subgroup domain-containing protein n=1 Tax=Sesamum alatum TaxID=300844 RepID=A0AAE1Z270_9LAMI|nr:hypothetical protein Salat_0425900 [Sesamum alatum]